MPRQLLAIGPSCWAETGPHLHGRKRTRAEFSRIWASLEWNAALTELTARGTRERNIAIQERLPGARGSAERGYGKVSRGGAVQLRLDTDTQVKIRRGKGSLLLLGLGDFSREGAGRAERQPGRAHRALAAGQGPEPAVTSHSGKLALPCSLGPAPPAAHRPLPRGDRCPLSWLSPTAMPSEKWGQGWSTLATY